MLAYSLEKAETTLCNICNLKQLPAGLKFVHVDRAAGEFLQAKLAGGTFPEIDVEQAAKQIKEGDVTIEFAQEASLAQKMEAFVIALKSTGVNELSLYRRLSW